MNRVSFIGRLTADPEMKTTQSGTSMTLTRLATNYHWKDASGEWKSGADFHRIVMFGKLAEQVHAGLKKGQRAYVEGKLRTRTWKNAAGETQFITEVLAHTCIFMDAQEGQRVEHQELVEDAEATTLSEEEMLAEDQVMVEEINA